MDIPSKRMKKIAMAMVIIAAIAAFIIFDLGRYLTYSYIKNSWEYIESLYASNQLAVIAAYMAIYILVTSLSLPGAPVMSVTGGALFGLVIGTIVVSIASTAGATIAFSVSRFILRDWVQKVFGKKLKMVNEGIAREGSLYLLTMRLVPAVPFVFVNLIMGVTKMPLKTFFWISQLGMLPATIVLVNAGKELARIGSFSALTSPGRILSLALLGIFPLAAKKLLAYYKSKRTPQQTETTS